MTEGAHAQNSPAVGLPEHAHFLATKPIGDAALAILGKIAPVTTAPATDDDTLLGLLDGTIGLVCRGEGRATRQLIEAARDLRVIGRAGAGYDNVDVVAATERGVAVVIAPVHGFAVAEASMALLLAAVKQVIVGDTIVRAGAWGERYDFLVGDLAEHTLGIVGLGRIGSRLAQLAEAFQMTVLACDPEVEVGAVVEGVTEIVGLEELLARSDFISLHVPLTDQTRGLIDRRRLKQIKRGAILLNAARGGVVESLDVLFEAIQDGQLSAVALDVFPSEPPDVSHPIFKSPRCLFSPHVAGQTALGMERVYQSMATDMAAVLSGARPVHCVNPEVFDGV